MKHKKLVLCALFLFGIGLTGIQAQSKLYVNNKSGTQTPFTLSSIHTLTFASGNMAVNKTDGTMSTYALSDLRYFSFSDYTTQVSPIRVLQFSKLTVYPNPVTDQLHISYETAMDGAIQVQIMDLQGKVLLQQELSRQTGSNHAQIAVSHLTNGLYLCRLQSGLTIETTKFLKQ